MRRYFERAHCSERARLRASASSSIRSVPARSILAAVDVVFKTEHRGERLLGCRRFSAAHRAARRAARRGRDLGADRNRTSARRSKAGTRRSITVSETSPRVKLAQRIARTVRRLVDGRRAGRHRAPRRALWRRSGPGAPARRIVRGDHPRAEERECRGRRRRPSRAHRAYRGHGSDGARRRAAVAARTIWRWRPCCAVRCSVSRTTICSHIAWDRGPLSLRAALARKAGETRDILEAADALLDELGARTRSAKRHSRFMRKFSAPAARGGAFSPGSAPRQTTRSTSFSISRFDYERRETPSLQGFLAWLREARAEVKRDMEIARDEVRVMTVHGAKGLEAPIVILADTMTPPAGPRQPRLLKLSGRRVIWAGRKADDAPAVAAARAGGARRGRATNIAGCSTSP